MLFTRPWQIARPRPVRTPGGFVVKNGSKMYVGQHLQRNARDAVRTASTIAKPYMRLRELKRGRGVAMAGLGSSTA
jgi:hypothetical protein